LWREYLQLIRCDTERATCFQQGAKCLPLNLNLVISSCRSFLRCQHLGGHSLDIGSTNIQLAVSAPSKLILSSDSCLDNMPNWVAIRRHQVLMGEEARHTAFDLTSASRVTHELVVER